MEKDALSIRTLVGAHYASLLRFLVVRLRNREDAEDLAQEVFLRLLRVPRSDLILRPDAYLYRIAANLVFEYRMRARRSLISYDSEKAELQSDSIAEFDQRGSTAEKQIDAAALQRAIDALPTRHRSALIMHRRDGLTYAEIGAEFGVSADMVKKYLASAVLRCRIALGEKK